MDEFFDKYRKDINKGLFSIDAYQLEKAARVIIATDKVYVGGNGGSAAIANHLACDMSKGIYPEMDTGVVSLSSNTALITAIANDMGYENSLVHQLELLKPTLQDTVILISSSGNSPNIVKAAEWAKDQGIDLIGFTGFSGGKLKELADIKIHVNSNNYGVIEDCHQAAMHCLSQYIKKTKQLSKSSAV